MSLLGYVNTLMQLLLSGAYSSAPASSESNRQNSGSVQPTGPGRRHSGISSEGFGQMGRIVETLLSAQSHHRAKRASPPSGSSEAHPGPAYSAAAPGLGQGDERAPNSGATNATAAGLENALSHLTNANAQAVVEALLGYGTSGDTAPTPSADARLAELTAIDLTEAEARALAEGRVLANRTEDILQRIVNAASSSQPQNASIRRAPPPQDFAQALAGALMAHLNAVHPAHGAYSTLSLAAVASGGSSALSAPRHALLV